MKYQRPTTRWFQSSLRTIFLVIGAFAAGIAFQSFIVGDAQNLRMRHLEREISELSSELVYLYSQKETLMTELHLYEPLTLEEAPPVFGSRRKTTDLRTTTLRISRCNQSLEIAKSNLVNLFSKDR